MHFLPDLLSPFPSPLSPFPIYSLANSPVLVHYIDLATYRSFQQQTDVHLFFQQLSESFSAEGKRIIHLWEDVWHQKPAVVLSRLRALMGQSVRIPARLTQVQRIDRPTLDQFLSTHHLQVVTQSKYKYGLFLPARYFRVLPDAFKATYLSNETDERLVAVATFSHPRTITRDGLPFRSFEMVRFANHLDTTVVGGIDKLLKAFVTDQYALHPPAAGHPFIDIMTYADRDWSDGRSYERLGFTRLDLTPPQQFWIRPGEWTRYYPHRLPEGLSEAEMTAHGYLPVFNAGSIKFLKKFDGF